MVGRVQRHAAADVEAFHIKQVFTEVLDTPFYCLTNVLYFIMNALCAFHWPFPSVCMVSTAEYPVRSALPFSMTVYTREPAVYAVLRQGCIKTIFG